MRSGILGGGGAEEVLGDDGDGFDDGIAEVFAEESDDLFDFIFSLAYA